jgi:hypothetical protein
MLTIKDSRVRRSRSIDPMKRKLRAVRYNIKLIGPLIKSKNIEDTELGIAYIEALGREKAIRVSKEIRLSHGISLRTRDRLICLEQRLKMNLYGSKRPRRSK